MQTSVDTNLAIGLPGQLADIGNSDIITRINNSKQLAAVTITAADLATTLTINGTAFTVNVGAASLTVTELRDLMIAAIIAGSEPVTPTIKDADELYVEADVSGTAFTVVGTTNCSVVNTIDNETGTPFGVGMTEDTATAGNDELAHAPKAAVDITTAGKFAGIAVHSHANEQAVLNANNVGYALASAMSIIRKGRVYVLVEDAVVKGGGVYCRYTGTTPFPQLGGIRSDGDTSKAGLIPNARFETSADAGGIAVVSINLP